MTSSAAHIAVIAGEASGDLQGACLAAEILRRLPGARIWGVGGRRMAEAGVEVRYDSSTWSAIGIAEGIKLVPHLARVFKRLRAELEANPPDLLVLIDFGFFNVRLGRRLGSRGTRVVYYFPPGSWRRKGDYRSLDGVADVFVSPYSWSAERMREQGLDARFFGHPLLDIVKPRLTRDEFCAQADLDASARLVALLPGSRVQEIRHNLPVLLDSATRLSEPFSDAQFVIPLAQTVDAQGVQRDVDRLGCEATVRLVMGMTYDALAHSRAAVVTSGTATLEAGILGVPMVIIYRGSRLTELEWRLLGRKIRFIGMPNIILDRLVCSELIQREASAERITQWMTKLIPDTPERGTMLADLSEVGAALGDPGAVAKTADLALELLGISPKEQYVEGKAE